MATRQPASGGGGGGKGGPAKRGAAQRRHSDRPDRDAPSILIESAEGIPTFPGLNGDRESQLARAFIHQRLAEIPAQRASARREPAPTDPAKH